MDGQLVSSPSDSSGDGDKGQSVPLLSYSKLFEEQFPYYLAIGMTYEQYWDGDVWLTKAYREAARIRRDMANAEHWLQGMYFYEALCDASPLFRDWVKNGTKAHPYPDAPYNIHPKKENALNQMEEEKRLAEKGERFMTSFMARFNKNFAKRSISTTKEVEEHEYND